MKKGIALFLALSLLAGFGCTASADDYTAFFDAFKYAEPVTVTIGRNASTLAFSLEGDTMENNSYIRWIKEYFNIDVQYAFLTASTDYDARVALAISSGDLPDIMYVGNETQMKMLIESGMAADLTDVIDRYASPLVQEIMASYGEKSDIFAKSTYDGRVYALRSFSPAYQYNMVWIRKDWLDRVGAAVPTTMEELENVAALFVENKLGGEGTTVGIEIANDIAGTYNTLGEADPVFGYFGAFPKQWIDDGNGGVTYGSLTAETRNALALLADWYAKGLIDPEFATKDFNASVSAGYSGITFGPWWVTSGPLLNAMTNDPQCLWQAIPMITNEEGTYKVYSNKSENSWAVVRADYEHPEIAMLLMNLVADTATLAREPITEFSPIRPESLRMIDSYPPGKWSLWPYTLDTQFANAQVLISKALVNAVNTGNTEGFPSTTAAEVASAIAYQKGETKELTAWAQWARYTARSVMAAADDILDVQKCYFPSTTETMTLMWDSLKTLESTTFTKIIMGELAIDEFDSFVSTWMNQGGEDILAEVNEQLGF